MLFTQTLYNKSGKSVKSVAVAIVELTRKQNKISNYFNNNIINTTSTSSRKYCYSHFSQFGPKGEALSQKKYWEDSYGHQNIKKEFDWLLDSTSVSHDIISRLKNSVGQNVLDLGCGNSSVSQKIIEKYCKAVCIHCLDYVPNVVEHQAKIHSQLRPAHPSSSFVGVVGDACSLPYRDNLFDIIIDKGTMDSLLKDNDKKRQQQKITLFLSETLRTLAPLGVFIQFTDEDPDIHLDTLSSLVSHLGLQKCCSLSFKLFESQNNYDCYAYSIKKLSA